MAPAPQFPSSSGSVDVEKFDNMLPSELLKYFDIPEGTVEYAPIKGTGHSGISTNIVTNAFEVSGNNAKTWVYQFDVGIIISMKRKNDQVIRYELNKTQFDGFKMKDYYFQTLKIIIIKLFPMIQHILQDQLQISEYSIISDFHRIFFTTDDSLKRMVESKKGLWNVVVPYEYIPFVKSLSPKSLENLQKVELEFKFTSEFDASDCLFKDSVNDKQGMQFFNLLVDIKKNLNYEEWANYNNGKSYLINPEKYEFKECDMPPLPDAKYLGMGSFSSVRQAGNIKNDSVGLIYVVDSIRTAFHAPQLLIKKFDEMITRPGTGARVEKMKFCGTVYEKILNNFKGLVCHCTHLDGKEITIHDIDDYGADTRQIIINNEKMTVQEYYLKKYNINLKFPSHPLIIQKIKQNEDEVADYQRVNQKSQTPDQIRCLIKACATNPSTRRFDIQRLFKALQVTNNEFLHYHNLTVQNNPIKVSGRILESPKIVYANNRLVNTKVDNKSWDIGSQDKFIIPSKITNWGCYYFEPVGIGKLTISDIRQFVDIYTRQARQKGIYIEDCYEIKQVASNEKHLEDLFIYLNKEKADFALFLSPDKLTEMHQFIKLYERKYNVTTQDLRQNTVKNVIFKKQYKTLDNILMKTNIKVGGLNYNLINSEMELIVNKNKLIIGIGFNHTRSGTFDGLSTVGFAANTTKNPIEFVGDVCFTKYQDNKKIYFYARILETVFENYLKFNGQPKEVIIYRTSGSEGKYDEYMRWDISYVKYLLQTYAPNAKLTFIIIEKNHNLRFFKEEINSNDRAPNQNVVPGTVVDNDVVRTKVCEFFLTSHSGIQGTSKTPRYCVLYDDNNYSIDEIENLTNALSYDYQIVNLPINLPAPVYIANQYADRGRMTMKAQNKDYSIDNDLLEAYNELGYKKSIFNNRRVNA
ncbi:Protein argonaute-2 [Strongyloides ratti]|uniref:Protein argonaute-2 n=1 Tax=Strongyloides ratti TaxID=34506 RepID=A0A090LK39_STRRB|nr:Protein argonaute-2 [Strongyloides ratti]CEF70078.1 Protein argonaute-2 [Strongyloides ratti]